MIHIDILTVKRVACVLYRSPSKINDKCEGTLLDTLLLLRLRTGSVPLR